MPDLVEPLHSSDFANLDDINIDLYFEDTQIYELAKLQQNQRKSVRYVRKDVTVFISQADVFGFYTLFSFSRAIKVKLFDISSRGILIGGPSRLKLRKNQKILLTVIFNSNKTFEIPARVAREIMEERKFYGIKFDKVNDALGDYLLESQTDLIFK
jgi:hypothetical protein